MDIKQFRNKFYPDTTISDLYVFDDTHKFSYCLEDKVRDIGIKIYGKTAIPENKDGYNVGITYSPHFKRDMVVLYDYIKDGEYVIDRDDVIFKQVYAHGGNDADDTEGCVIVAKNFALIDNKPKVWKSLENELFKLVKTALDKNEIIKWYIINVK